MLEAFLTDYTLRTVALGAAALGVVSGGLGTFAVLRRQSLLGDAISHAALPGIALAYLLTASKTPLVLMAGAAGAGWVGTLAVRTITRRSRVPFDAGLGMVLSVFFGIGLVMLTYIQARPDAGQAGLDKFLFGQAAALVTADVVTIAGLGAVALAMVALFWKEFKVLAFDPDFASALGFRVGLLDTLLTTVLVIAIVVGLQTVGVVLMSAMLIAPAAAARQWTDRLGALVVLAAALGAMAGVAGAVISATTAHLPTGPTIVLCASAIVVVSLLAAPDRGIVARALRERGGRRTLRVAGVLEDLYALGLQHGNPRHAHAAATLRTMTLRPESVEPTLAALADRGLVAPAGEDSWALTQEGVEEAERLSGRG